MSVDVAALYRAHAPSLFRYLVRTTGRPDLAEDVLHDTFGRLLERPPADADGVRGWLFTVATNRLRDLHRSGRRRDDRVHALDAERTVADPPPRPDEALASARARERLRAALDGLSERDRTVLLMREEGFRHREIAEAVGTTTGSVGTLVARALNRLSDLLEETS